MLPFIIPLLFLIFPPPGNATAEICFSTQHAGARHAELYNLARARVSAVCRYAVVVDESSRKAAFWRAGAGDAREDCLVSRVRGLLDKWHDARFVTDRAREKLTRDVMDNILAGCSSSYVCNSDHVCNHNTFSAPRADTDGRDVAAFLMALFTAGIVVFVLVINNPHPDNCHQVENTPSSSSNISSDDSDDSSSDDSDSD